MYSELSTNFETIHAQADGTPGSQQIRFKALTDIVAGFSSLLDLSQDGCRPGGDMGKVVVSLLYDIYYNHHQSNDTKRTQRNLRRKAYDLRVLLEHLYDPAIVLMVIGNRKGWAFDLSLNPGSLLDYHLNKQGYTIDSLLASVSLNDLVFSRRNLEFYHRDSYRLSIHDLPLIRRLSQEIEVQRGLDQTVSWLTPYPMNSANALFYQQVLEALGWLGSFNVEQHFTLSVLLPEWDGTIRELLESVRLL